MEAVASPDLSIREAGSGLATDDRRRLARYERRALERRHSPSRPGVPDGPPGQRLIERGRRALELQVISHGARAAKLDRYKRRVRGQTHLDPMRLLVPTAAVDDLDGAIITSDALGERGRPPHVVSLVDQRIEVDGPIARGIPRARTLFAVTVAGSATRCARRGEQRYRRVCRSSQPWMTFVPHACHRLDECQVYQRSMRHRIALGRWLARDRNGPPGCVRTADLARRALLL